MERRVLRAIWLVGDELIDDFPDVLPLREVPPAWSAPKLDAEEAARPAALFDAVLDCEDLLLSIDLGLRRRDVDVVVDEDSEGVELTLTVDDRGGHVDAAVADHRLVAELLADEGVIGRVPDVACLRKTVEGLLEVQELALELGVKVDKSVGELHEDMVDVELAVKVRLVDVGLLDDEIVLGGVVVQG